MVNDRRNNEERRSEDRFALNLDIEWEGLIGRQKGTVSDVSTLGCFVLCSGEVEDGEHIKLFFPIGDGMKAQFWGEVVNHVFEIGFGVRFVELNTAQRDYLRNLIESIK